MTIEKYLKKSAEEIENTLPKGDTCDGNIYLEGKMDAYWEILKKLPSFDHEVTLKEVKEECQKHGSEGGCYGCVLLHRPSCAVPYYCGVGGIPVRWGINRIEEKMKGARK